MARAGFADIDTYLEPAPATFASAAEFRLFVSVVVLRPHLEELSSAHLRELFVDRLVEQAAHDDPPFTLDYWRLNLHGRVLPSPL